MPGIKLYIADDHSLIRKALVQLFKTFSRIEIVKEAENGKVLLDLVKDERPDVVILDLNMPIMNGMIACEKLANDYPEVKIIVVTMHDQLGNLVKTLNAGAHAFLSKEADPLELEQAVYGVIDNGIYRNQQMLEALRTQLPQNFNNKLELKRSNPFLSAREHSILKLLCDELTNRQIAIQLGLSENTIRNHRVRMMRKADVKNSLGLIKFAVENGYSR